MKACEWNRVEAAKLLIDAGAAINARNAVSTRMSIEWILSVLKQWGPLIYILIERTNPSDARIGDGQHGDRKAALGCRRRSQRVRQCKRVMYCSTAGALLSKTMSLQEGRNAVDLAKTESVKKILLIYGASDGKKIALSFLHKILCVVSDHIVF
jgi:hypothetical protein